MARVTTTKTLAVSGRTRPPLKPKPKNGNAAKIVKNSKKLISEQEVRQRQTGKDNAKGAEKMNAFVQRPRPKYMSAAQFARKKELTLEKEEIFATVKKMEERLLLLLDPVMVLKNQIGSQKSRLNYIGAEMKTFFGLKEPEEGHDLFVGED